MIRFLLKRVAAAGKWLRVITFSPRYLPIWRQLRAFRGVLVEAESSLRQPNADRVVTLAEVNNAALSITTGSLDDTIAELTQIAGDQYSVLIQRLKTLRWRLILVAHLATFTLRMLDPQSEPPTLRRLEEIAASDLPIEPLPVETGHAQLTNAVAGRILRDHVFGLQALISQIDLCLTDAPKEVTL